MAVDISTKKYLDLDGLKQYDQKIKAELAKKVSSIDPATETDLGLVKIGDGIAVDDGEISVKPKTGGVITVTDAGVDVDFSKGTKATSDTLGLVTVGNGIDVTDGKIAAKPKTNSGIAVDGDGIAVSLKTNGGLEVNEGVGVKIKSEGGIALDVNGLSVDWDKAPVGDILTSGKGISISESQVSFNPSTVDDASIPLSKITGSADLAKKSDLTNVYTYKGSVNSYSELSSKEGGAVAGDVYDVKDTDMNYAWTGDSWDPLGSTFSITSITTGEIDALFTD